MILLMGIAGSGKGTQGKMLADQYGLHLISMGDVVRMYVTGDQRKKMLAGELLNDKEIISIVDKVLDSIPSNEEVLIDGFPRTIPQAEWLLKKSQEGNHLKLDLAIHLVASREAVKDRLMKRARIDDKDNAIEARFDEYHKATMPIIKWLEENNIKVANVNAERAVEDVNQDLANLLKELSQE
jgi:adenylate kinase